MSKVSEQIYDALVIGAGGAGLRAALELSRKGLKVAVVSKVFPTRSHTVAAQGGINAALGNVSADNWQWHMYDTIKGSDYLGDQDAIEFMCEQASKTVIELEHFGVPFSRLDNGTIYQRAFGGQSQNFGEAQAHRTCAAADRTGHAILHSLYQQNIQAGTEIFSEHFALDLLQDQNGTVHGAFIMDIASSETRFLRSRNTLLATGGAGQVFRTNTNASINTGDGLGMAMRAGIPLQDMEFWQFHPTGVAGRGMLISEAARGEGGILRNADNDAFMKNYAPKVKELASRDVVARAIAIEVNEGRGCGDHKDHVLLDLTHMDAEQIKERLPGIRDISLTFLGIDPLEAPMPIFPTCHYMMGGIPTNLNGQAIKPSPDNPDNQIPVAGLYAMGECACVSVHGANRLGGNSLLDIVVFGKQAAQHISQSIDQQALTPPAFEWSQSNAKPIENRWHHWKNARQTDDTIAEIKNDLQTLMEKSCGVFRQEDSMQQGIADLEKIGDRICKVGLQDHSDRFNLERLYALELENLYLVAKATLFSAQARKESRGAHTRVDFTERNDDAWLKHTLFNIQTDFSYEGLSYKPVNRQPKHHAPFEPKPRVY